MSTRKRWALAILAGLMLAIAGTCSALSPPIFPATPPDEFHKIHVGMHIKDVLPLFKQAPNVLDDRKVGEEEREKGPIWMHWYVHDGLIQVCHDKDGLVEFVHFQASRSSVVENVREVWNLKRFFH